MKHNFLDNAFKQVIKEGFEADGNFYVYHGCPSSAAKGLSNAGFERSWTSSNGGNMYGIGVYTTFSFGGGSNARGGYGSTIIKALVKSLNNYVIYKEDIAKKVYGEFNVANQIYKIFGKDFYDELKHTNEMCRNPEWGMSKVTFDRVVNAGNREKSSESALALAAFINDKHPEMEYRFNGFIFCGNHDDDVCFIKDFKNVYPVAISKDGGRHFGPITASDEFDKFAKNDIDLHFQLGKHNFKLMKELSKFPNYFINNFARVEKSGRYNYLYRGRSLKLGVISPVWFDEAPETFSDRGTAMVLVENTPYMLVLNNNNFYVYSKEGEYLCDLENFDHFLNDISYEDDFDEEF